MNITKLLEEIKNVDEKLYNAIDSILEKEDVNAELLSNITGGLAYTVPQLLTIFEKLTFKVKKVDARLTKNKVVDYVVGPTNWDVEQLYSYLYEDVTLHIEDLTDDELIKLRSEIVLNSVYTSDYQNSLNVDAAEVESFFNGFINYIDEKMNEETNNLFDNADDTYWEKLSEYDTVENLLDYATIYE